VGRSDSAFQKRVILTVIILFINLIFISNSVVLENNRSILGNLVHSLISPFRVLWNSTIDFISDKLKHYVFIRNEYKKVLELKKKNRQLLYENYRIKREAEENNRHIPKDVKKRDYVTADVISINSAFPLSGALINRGIIHGIKRGMVVVNEKMELVGKIAEPVTLFSSGVRFLTNPSGGTGAVICSNRLEGLLKGNNSNTCSFNYVIGNREVRKGEEVVTSGTDMVYPPDLKIGKVIRVEKGVLVLKIFVRPYFVDEPVRKLIILGKK